jgi:IS1 family transposase
LGLGIDVSIWFFGRAQDPDHVHAVFAETRNLTMRTSVKHFARWMSAFSKWFENHRHALALYLLF